MKFTYYVFQLWLICILLSSCESQTNNSETILDKNSVSTVESQQSPTSESPRYKDEIYVKTIQVGGESMEELNKLQVSYPHTAYTFVNEKEEKDALEFKKSFEVEAEKVSEGSVSGVTYLQHFDVREHTDSVLVLHIEKNISYGNNFEDQFYTRYYDLIHEKQIEVKDLFISQQAFEKFTQTVKSQLINDLRARIYKDKNYTTEERNMLWQNMKEDINQGTEAKGDNYNSILFDAGNEIVIQFDKYQVAPGSMGAIETRIRKSDVRPLIKQEYRTIFHLQGYDHPEKETPSSDHSDISPDSGHIPSTNETTSSEKKPEHTPENDPDSRSTESPQGGMIALTFDDGPSIYTPELLDILQKNNVKATFFILGKSAKVQHKTVERAHAEGHQIANHSWNHKNLTKVSTDEVKRQVEDTNNTIASITHEQATVMRPPYGAINSEVKSIANMPLILWNIDPQDWKDRDAKIVAERMSKAKANAIILGHDIHQTTVQAIPEVISSLHSKGFWFVTIDEMFAGQNLQKGRVYSHK